MGFALQLVDWVFYNYYLVLGAVLIIILIRFIAKGRFCQLTRDLTDKIVIITGSNTGIGYQAALRLAGLNATIVLACRDEKRATEAQQSIIKLKNNPKIHFIKLDLSDLGSVEEFVQNFKAQFNKLDILINNAGLYVAFQRSLTKNGFQKMVGTNHLGHFHLTNLLLDTLQKTENSRIINVSSDAHKMSGEIEWDNYNAQKEFKSFRSYSYSKLSNVYHAMVLQNLFNDSNIKCQAVSLHPGAVRTDIIKYREKSWWLLIIWFVFMYPIWILVAKSCQGGAQTTIQCALQDFDKLVGGEYYAECQVAKRGEAFTKDKNKAKKLWELSEKLVLEALKSK